MIFVNNTIRYESLNYLKIQFFNYMYLLTHLDKNTYNGNRLIQDIVVKSLPNIQLINIKESKNIHNSTIFVLHPHIFSEALLGKNNNFIIIFHDNYEKFIINCMNRYRLQTAKLLGYDLKGTKSMINKIVKCKENIKFMFLNQNDMNYYNFKRSSILKFFECNDIIMKQSMYNDTDIINFVYTGSNNRQNYEYLTELIKFLSMIDKNIHFKLNICGKIADNRFRSHFVNLIPHYDNLYDIDFINPIGINNNLFQTGISTKNLNFIDCKYIIFSRSNSKMDFLGNYPIHYFNNYNMLKNLLHDFKNLKELYPKNVKLNYSENYKTANQLTCQ
jgi:hypothetical protein